MRERVCCESCDSAGLSNSQYLSFLLCLSRRRENPLLPPTDVSPLSLAVIMPGSTNCKPVARHALPAPRLLACPPLATSTRAPLVRHTCLGTSTCTCTCLGMHMQILSPHANLLACAAPASRVLHSHMRRTTKRLYVVRDRYRYHFNDFVTQEWLLAPPTAARFRSAGRGGIALAASLDHN